MRVYRFILSCIVLFRHFRIVPRTHYQRRYYRRSEMKLSNRAHSEFLIRILSVKKESSLV